MNLHIWHNKIATYCLCKVCFLFTNCTIQFSYNSGQKLQFSSVFCKYASIETDLIKRCCVQDDFNCSIILAHKENQSLACCLVHVVVQWWYTSPNTKWPTFLADVFTNKNTDFFFVERSPMYTGYDTVDKVCAIECVWIIS